MKKPIRTKTDGRQQEYSRRTATHTPGPDLARQEFRQTTDINFILSRHGAAGLRAAQLGAQINEVNYDLDLQQALAAVAAARMAHRKMSKATKEKYPTWQSLLNAVEAGEFTMPKEGEESTRVDSETPAETPKPKP